MNTVLKYYGHGTADRHVQLAEARTIGGDAAVDVAGGNDPRVMAKSILQLLRFRARSAQGANGRERIETMFDWKNQRRIYLEAYAGL